MPHKNHIALAILLAAGPLTACGQKGPLYLPQDAAVPAEPTAATPVASPVDAAPATAAPQAGNQDEDSKQNKTGTAEAAAGDNTENTTTEPVIEK